MESKHFELPIGLTLNGENHKEVELLGLNGVAEKIITTKIAEKIYTWQGNVVSASVKSIGNIEIAADVRQKYSREGSVTIPYPVLQLPLGEVNTLLVEIHRRLWENLIPKQEIICKYCGTKLISDIDLDKIDYMDEDKERLASMVEFDFIHVNLKNGFTPPAVKAQKSSYDKGGLVSSVTDRPEFAGITEATFNRFTFRVPILQDAIKNEKYATDSITFWRRIAADCLVEISRVEDGDVVEVFPSDLLPYYNGVYSILTEYLTVKDLKRIRDEVIGFIPTLPFAYFDPCEVCGRDTPMVMEASNFFSE